MNFQRLLKNWKRVVLPPSIHDWWLERQINIEFAQQIKEARTKKNHDEIMRLEYEHRWNLADIHDSRQARIQKKWIRKARKLMIHVTPPNYAHDKERTRIGIIAHLLAKFS
jgi:hypothetical protein